MGQREDKVNRRSFIKRSALLLGLFITEPRQALNCISYLHKSPLSWHDKILQLYPDPDRSPLAEILRHARPGVYKGQQWWEDDLELNGYQAYIGRTRE